MSLPSLADTMSMYIRMPTTANSTQGVSLRIRVKKPGQGFDPWPDPTRNQIADPLNRWPVTRRPGSISCFDVTLDGLDCGPRNARYPWAKPSLGCWDAEVQNFRDREGFSLHSDPWSRVITVLFYFSQWKACWNIVIFALRRSKSNK